MVMEKALSEFGLLAVYSLMKMIKVEEMSVLWHWSHTRGGTAFANQPHYQVDAGIRCHDNGSHCHASAHALASFQR